MSFQGVEGTRPYAGTAWYYAQYRPKPSDRFVALLASHLGWSSDDRILDLGCGPGQIALQLAPYVGEVVGVDAEPEMVEEGARRAAAAGLDSVTFLHGSSDALADLVEAIGPVTAVTIGSAFHWMTDQDRVLRDLDALVDPARGAVLILAFHVGGPDVRVTGRDDRPWHERPPWTQAKALLDSYLVAEPERPHPGGRHDPFPDIFARSRFPRLELLRYEYDEEQQPSVDGALGRLYSVSHVLGRLGARRADYEAEVHAILNDAPTDPATVRVTDSALIAMRPALGG